MYSSVVLITKRLESQIIKSIWDQVIMTHAYYNPLKTAIQCDIFSGNRLILHSVSVVEEVQITFMY
jgi:hypothetical protein